MTRLDTLLTAVDRGLRSVSGVVRADRPNPAGDREAPLNDAERRHAAGLMRVNHCGEICAQALYEGHVADGTTTGDAGFAGRRRPAGGGPPGVVPRAS